MADEPLNFLARLKQHHLYGVVVAYAVVVGFLIQLVSRAFPYFGWAGAVPAVIIVLLLGFPVVVVLAWLFIKPKNPTKSDTWQRRHWKLSAAVTLAVIVLVVISGFYGLRFSERRASGLEATTAATPAAVQSTLITSVAPSAATLIPAKSIAVLPFVNMSGDPKEDYFSDGITEEILNALAQAPDLQVAARTSAFAFKGKNEDLRKIGEALGVAHVLEGSVQKSGDEVRITAQLIDTRSGYHLWSEKFDRKLTNIFAVEDEISKAIADKLQAQLGAGETANAGTSDPRAHELYLRGLTLLAARGPGLRIAADTFRQAVAIDPKYAQAWAELAQAELQVRIWYYDSDGTAMAAADDAAWRALQLDPNVAAAHVALGVLHEERKQWADADREFRRALELAPNDVEALDQYAQFLYNVGSPTAALPVIERANRLDPYSGVIGSVHAGLLMHLRRYDAAQAQIDRTLGMAPDSQIARGVALGLALLRKDYTAAEAQARVFALQAGQDPEDYAALVRGVADPAQRGSALRLLNKLSAGEHRFTAHWRILLGDREGAIQNLETAYGGATVGDTFQLWNPQLDPLREDPRFKALLKKLSLPYTPKDMWAP